MLSVSRCYISRFKGQWFCLKVRLTPHFRPRYRPCLPSYYATLQIKDTGTRIPDPLFPHLVPPAIMVWIFVWKYIFEPFIHILQHFVLQLSRSTNLCTYIYTNGKKKLCILKNYIYSFMTGYLIFY